MSRSVYVLAASAFAVGGVMAAWFATREGPAAGPPQRPQAAPASAPTHAQPPLATDVPMATPTPAAAPLPEPKPAAVPMAAVTAAETIEALFERALRLANEQRNEKGAIALFKQVVARQDESRLFAARALFEIGCCLERMARGREALGAFRMVVELYSDQREPAEAARRRLPQVEQENLAFYEEFQKRLAEGRVDMDLVNETLGYAAEILREQAKINVIIDAHSIPDPFDRRLTLRLWNAPVSEALDRIVGSTDARWYLESGYVMIAARAALIAEEKKAPPSLPDWGADLPAWKQEEEAMRTALAARPASWSLTDANLADMTRAFQEATTKLIVIDDALARDVDAKRITFRVQDLDPSQGLDLICKMLEIAWYVDRGTIHVTTGEAAEAWRKAHE